MDPDRKLIYIRTNKNDNNNEYSDYNEQNKNGGEIKEESLYINPIFWVIISLGIFVINLIIFIIFCLKKYLKTKRTNEIDDDVDYDYKNQEENEGIN